MRNFDRAFCYTIALMAMRISTLFSNQTWGFTPMYHAVNMERAKAVRNTLMRRTAGMVIVNTSN